MTWPRVRYIVVVRGARRAAAEAWAAKQELEAARAREAATALGDMYAAERPVNSRPVELLVGAALTLQTFEDLIVSAQTEIRGFDRGPYLTTATTERDDVQLEAMARGVSYRVIYQASVLGDEHNMRTLRASVASGEQARAFPELPMKLVIFDNRTALIPAHRADGSDVDALVVHPSPMLDALVEIHEAFWRLSAPIHAETPPDPNAQDSDSPAEPSTQTNHLLALLTAGLTDESIARMIGISERTVSRRVSRLQELLGARTRFQLGVQASRRGWI